MHMRRGLVVALAVVLAVSMAGVGARRTHSGANELESASRRHRRRHSDRYEPQANNSTAQNSTLLDKLRSNTKRCRYSSADQEELENYAKRNQVKTATTYEESFNYYGSHHLDDRAPAYRSGSLIKQPRVREQSGAFNRHHHAHQLDPSIEIEKLFVDIGETINLTCNINAKEIDWHFKDRNLTTTIISNGPQLQVEQAQIVTAVNEERMGLVLKYKLNSDRHSRHMLTLYVQGSQDEGSYQCIDSKSETPIKKTIRLILKNNSQALTSGIACKNASSWLLVFALFLLHQAA